jgi:hypothetical protein
MDLGKNSMLGCGLNSAGSGQDPLWWSLVSMVINLQVSLKGGEYLDQVNDYQCLKASWSYL